ncbi:MAG TPA: DUF1592 domain-containing protein [Polyangiaceae bacterium]|nr:DUF1592 domain-containing protein [Polyangiaceae bacterium]
MRWTWGLIVLAGCVGNIGGESTELIPPETGVPVVGMRRLSTYEYEQTLFDLLGDASVDSESLLPQDAPSPFDNDYATQVPSRPLIDGIETLAGQATAKLLADPARRDALVDCAPADAADRDCLSHFVRRFGRRALRRPLGEDEVTQYVDLGASFAAQTSDFYTGVEVITRALLQDIEFLYRVERGTPVPDHAGMFRLEPFEIATRMSYLIWATTPSDALLDLAASGGLDTPAQALATAEGMLDDPRARTQIDRFHAMWLGYNELPHAPELTAAMRTETRALVERVVFDEQRSWLELFLSNETYVDDTLAAHYGLPLPGEPRWMDYSADGRRGLLSHGSFLSVAHDVGQTSPVKRGLHVLRRLMCSDVPPPPPDVDTNLVTDAGECRSDQLDAHAQGSCAGCHAAFDPIGRGLDRYDVAGRFRTFEEGKPQCLIDGAGELPGVGPFQGPAELGDRLVASGMLEGCAVQHLYQYALGRRVQGGDDALIAHLTKLFVDSGQRFDRLVVAMVADDAFFFRREEQP